MAVSPFTRLRDFHANLPAALRWIAWLAVIGAMVAWLAPPSYRYFRAWRADRNLDAARVALEEGKPREARGLALAAVRLAPQSFDAVRLLGRALESDSDPLAMQVAGFLISHPESTVEDKTLGFRIFTRDAPLAQVGAAWAALGEKATQNPDVVEAFSRRLIGQTHYQEAALLLQAAFAKDIRSPWLDVLWVDLATRSGQPEDMREARSAGIRVLDGHPELGGDVLASWLRLPGEAITGSMLDSARRWLQKRGTAAPPEEVVAFRVLEIKAMPTEARSAAIDEMTESWREKAPGPLANHLIELGRLRAAVDVASQPGIDGDLDAFRAAVKARVVLQDWHGLLEFLSQAPDSMPALELALERMRAASLAGDGQRRNQELKLARELAAIGKSGNGYLELAEMAVAAGMEEAARNAMVDALRLGRGRIPLHDRLRPLIESLAVSGRGGELFEVFTRLAALEPGNPIVISNYCYFGLLYGLVQPPFALERMEPVIKAFPKEQPARAVAGLAHLSAGNPGEAVKVTTMSGVDWTLAGPAFRAVRGSALLLDGDTESAKLLLDDLPWQDLMPIETNYFFRLLQPIATGPDAPPWLSRLRQRREEDGGAAVLIDPTSAPSHAP